VRCLLTHCREPQVVPWALVLRPNVTKGLDVLPTGQAQTTKTGHLAQLMQPIITPIHSLWHFHTGEWQEKLVVTWPKSTHPTASGKEE